ncbi:Calcineurin-like phosphoesterase domain [Theobroma cacao]|nr:Calcineurin-like phosphoesterase domain [Theobroma cacao]
MGSSSSSPSLAAFAVIVLALVLSSAVLCNGGKTSVYVRKVEKTVDMPLDSDVFGLPSGYNAPQQVHITQGDHVGKAVIVSWVTDDEPGSSTVLYWSENSKQKKMAEGKVKTYKFYNYTSGYIHHCTIRNLEYNTKYYYMVGVGHTMRKFWFTTPPEVGPDVPYTFGLIGDLGQTFDSNSTLTHYEQNPRKGQTVLFVGDLSYADNYPNHDNVRWDTWARFVERSVAYQPWIWTAGNHEIDFAPEIINGQPLSILYLLYVVANSEGDIGVGETKPFKPYTHRYHVPYRASKSTAPFWYSIKRASAYIIVLSSYSAYGMYTPQYQWLKGELPKVKRSETPWLIVLMHSPWYNSYNYHYMEGETMRVMYEPWFVQYKVDVVFAGHVHAYERSERVSNIAYNIVNGICTPVKNQSAPVYITIGDGGNIEGLATNMTEPQPAYSAYREASFGHAIFDIKNRTHAYYSWHRNHDGYAIEADSMWFFNRFWHPVDESATSQ